jgi:hypothetical protein
MDPEEAVQACCDVGIRVMVPMHWAAFRLSREPALEPIERTRAAWAAVRRNRAVLWDLAVGESPPTLSKLLSPSWTAALLHALPARFDARRQSSLPRLRQTVTNGWIGSSLRARRVSPDLKVMASLDVQLESLGGRQVPREPEGRQR